MSLHPSSSRSWITWTSSYKALFSLWQASKIETICLEGPSPIAESTFFQTHDHRLWRYVTQWMQEINNFVTTQSALSPGVAWSRWFITRLYYMTWRPYRAWTIFVVCNWTSTRDPLDYDNGDAKSLACIIHRCTQHKMITFCRFLCPPLALSLGCNHPVRASTWF